MKNLIASTLPILCLAACSSNVERKINEYKNDIRVANIYANTETTPVTSLGDAADDPAFWYNKNKPELSLLLGTNKQKGLDIYNLKGERVQSLNVGRMNNIDLRQDLKIDNSTQDIAVASNRTNNTLSVFSISDSGEINFIGSHGLALPEPYGTCMYSDTNNNSFVFVNDKNGQYQQWLIQSLSPLSLKLTREFKLASQPEGCTAHDESGMLFIGEEEYGIWRLDLNDTNSKPELLTKINDGVLVADVEGMDIYLGEYTNYLVVSSQGDNSYAVYDIEKNASGFEYKGSFRIIADEQKGIDGTQETDGLALSSMNFGANFPEGIVAIQDGFNRKPKEAQNFKLVSWKKIRESLLWNK